MIPYSRPKLSDLYTLSQSKLLENPSSETQGQIVGARESLNRRENMAQEKSKERSFLFFVSYFSARLDFPLPPLSAPGSPRMLENHTLHSGT